MSADRCSNTSIRCRTRRLGLDRLVANPLCVTRRTLSAAIASRAALSIEQMPKTEPLSDVEGERARRFAALPDRER
jgi:hypothetical protein